MSVASAKSVRERLKIRVSQHAFGHPLPQPSAAMCCVDHHIANPRERDVIAHRAREADLEFALARAAGLISDDTLVVTTVHELQLRDADVIPWADHDAPAVQELQRALGA